MPLELVDERGASAWRAELSSYGQLRHLEGVRAACPFRYPGQYEDAETGLYYNRFRYYDPQTGAYISQDPIGLAGGPALYAYVADPYKQVDIFGLSGTCPLIEVKYIFHGEINAGGKPVGFHHEGPIGHIGKARVNTIIDPPNTQGIYRAKVEIFDANASVWKAKNAPLLFPK